MTALAPRPPSEKRPKTPRWCVYRAPECEKPIAYFATRAEADRDETARNIIAFAQSGSHGGYFVRKLTTYDLHLLAKARKR